MSLENFAEEYFSKINPIANRMYVDMREVKSAYEDLWTTLTDEEQKQILSESIIKPEISILYKDNENTCNVDKYAVKRIVDDNYSYRDEHSGPFSFRTPSQRDLTIFEKEKTKSSIAHKKIPKPKPPPPPPPVVHKPKKTEEETDFTEDILFSAKSDTESKCSTLPKTGLDFLDNW